MDFFDNYVKKYDITNEHISYKYHHSYRVMDNMSLLAKNMNLPYEDIKVAKCIGILHDIGRFEQYKQFKSFDDFNMDHAAFGANLIKENNVLSNFDISPEDYEVVYKAIENHNKLYIEPNLTSRELLFAKMIRDADKLDILYALGTDKLKKIVYEDDGIISKKNNDNFMHEKIIKIEPNFSKNEHLLALFAFVYDINFNISLNIIKTNNYYGLIYNRLKNKKIFKPYLDKINEYLKERTE